MAKIKLTTELLIEQRQKMLQLRENQQNITKGLKDAVNTMNEGLTDNLRHNSAAKTSMVLNYSHSFESVLGWGADAIEEAVRKYQQVQGNIIHWINQMLNFFMPNINTPVGVVTVNENGSISNRQGVEIDPFKSNAEGQRSADAYREVLADLDVEKRARYQRRASDGATWCNIYVWDATKAMGCEIPHYYDPNTGLECREAGVYKEMGAIRMREWLENFGSQHGWIECDQATAIAMANKGMPTVVAATTTGHVGMVVPQNEGDTDVMISQAGASNFNYGKQSNGFGKHSVKYFYHA